MLVLRNKHPQRTWASTLGIVALWGALRFGAILGLMVLALVGLLALADPVDERKISVLADGWMVLALGAGTYVTFDILRGIECPPASLAP